MDHNLCTVNHMYCINKKSILAYLVAFEHTLLHLADHSAHSTKKLSYDNLLCDKGDILCKLCFKAEREYVSQSFIRIKFKNPIVPRVSIISAQNLIMP